MPNGYLIMMGNALVYDRGLFEFDLIRHCYRNHPDALGQLKEWLTTAKPGDDFLYYPDKFRVIVLSGYCFGAC